MLGKVMLLTTHCWNSKRRAGFHWIADALWQQGFDVYFVTAGLSYLDRLKHSYHFDCLPEGRVRTLVQEKPRLHSYVIYHPWRPARCSSDLVNRVLYGWFSTYGRIPLPGLEGVVQQMDQFIFEPSMAVMFFDRFKNLNSSARYVYRVSDDLDLFNVHPVVKDTERRISPEFDLISSPTREIHAKFASLPNARYHPHGVPLDLYARSCPSPYSEGTLNAVFVGNLCLDVSFIERASRLFPHIVFHVIGPFSDLPQRDNVIGYGEIPYEETIPYVKHADIGLNPRTMPSLGESNKVMQYTHCRLPVINSDINPTRMRNVFYYHIGDDASIANAIQQSLGFDRFTLTAAELPLSWGDLATCLVEANQ
ncbi:MAG: GumK N-terminal domain-containing glycosyltransferase [Anaerolineae bacterium]